MHRAAPRSLVALLASARRRWSGLLGADLGGATWALAPGGGGDGAHRPLRPPDDLEAVWRVGLDAFQQLADRNGVPMPASSP
ncbi:MAG: hypothetical protein GEV08_07340 [Acidimicrobiia bacterium]|nr:hypothetical protein [Acidimicrobiia bacterium]